MGYKICLNLGLFLSLGVGIAMVRSGSLTPATYLFFAIMGIIFYRPLEALMGSFAMMNLANASLDNIAEINNLRLKMKNRELHSLQIHKPMYGLKMYRLAMMESVKQLVM